MRSKSHDLTKRKGLMVLYDGGAFTLIELVMVILLIGILSAVVLPKFVNLTGLANEAASEGVVGSLDEGLMTHLRKIWRVAIYRLMLRLRGLPKPPKEP